MFQSKNFQKQRKSNMLQVNNLNSVEFEKYISEDENAVIIDVRTEQEFKEVRLPNSVLIDIYRQDFFEKVEQLDRSKNYYVYCRSGSRSYNAAWQMLQMGFNSVYNLESGIINWEGEVEEG